MFLLFLRLHLTFFPVIWQNDLVHTVHVYHVRPVVVVVGNRLYDLLHVHILDFYCVNIDIATSEYLSYFSLLVVFLYLQENMFLTKMLFSTRRFLKPNLI